MKDIHSMNNTYTSLHTDVLVLIFFWVLLFMIKDHRFFFFKLRGHKNVFETFIIPWFQDTNSSLKLNLPSIWKYLVRWYLIFYKFLRVLYYQSCVKIENHMLTHTFSPTPLAFCSNCSNFSEASCLHYNQKRPVLNLISWLKSWNFFFAAYRHK